MWAFMILYTLVSLKGTPQSPSCAVQLSRTLHPWCVETEINCRGADGQFGGDLNHSMRVHNFQSKGTVKGTKVYLLFDVFSSFFFYFDVNYLCPLACYVDFILFFYICVLIIALFLI